MKQVKSILLLGPLFLLLLSLLSILSSSWASQAAAEFHVKYLSNPTKEGICFEYQEGKDPVGKWKSFKRNMKKDWIRFQVESLDISSPKDFVKLYFDERKETYKGILSESIKIKNKYGENKGLNQNQVQNYCQDIRKKGSSFYNKELDFFLMKCEREKSSSVCEGIPEILNEIYNNSQVSCEKLIDKIISNIPLFCAELSDFKKKITVEANCRAGAVGSNEQKKLYQIYKDINEVEQHKKTCFEKRIEKIDFLEKKAFEEQNSLIKNFFSDKNKVNQRILYKKDKLVERFGLKNYEEFLEFSAKLKEFNKNIRENPFSKKEKFLYQKLERSQELKKVFDNVLKENNSGIAK